METELEKDFKIGMVSIVNINRLENYARKAYFKDNREEVLKSHWNKEVEALKLLEGEEHFPQIIDIDEIGKVIKMTYCGENLTKENLPENWEVQCDEITNILKGKNIFHADIYLKNILVKHGIIYLIDFGIWQKVIQKVKSIKDTIKELINAQPDR